MTNTLPKIHALDKPASPDTFGISNSPIGFMLAAWQGDYLVKLILLPAHADKEVPGNLPDYDLSSDLTQDDTRAKKLVKEHLFPDNQWNGTPSKDLKIGFYGTDFQQKVMHQMLKTPEGQTTSYGLLAAKAGNVGAARAAGSVCAKNPIPFIVPCHRILNSTGGLGGFLYGTALKRQLLEWEKKTAITRAA